MCNKKKSVFSLNIIIGERFDPSLISQIQITIDYKQNVCHVAQRVDRRGLDGKQHLVSTSNQGSILEYVNDGIKYRVISSLDLTIFSHT